MDKYDEESALFEDTQICIKTEIVYEDETFENLDDTIGMQVVKVETIKTEKVQEATDKLASLIVFNETVVKQETTENHLFRSEEFAIEEEEPINVENEKLSSPNQGNLVIFINNCICIACKTKFNEIIIT